LSSDDWLPSDPVRRTDRLSSCWRGQFALPQAAHPAAEDAAQAGRLLRVR